MRFSIPEISWHNRDPVLSADFQPKSSPTDPLRLATGGTDSHVLIWHVSVSDIGAVNLEVAADLARHQKAVNVVRWSPGGQFLASGDDEAIIFVWKQRTDKDPPAIFDQNNEQDRETWIIHKTLRGHMEDVLDLSWSACSSWLASGSVDNKVLCWDVARARTTATLNDHKGFVQGVAWDPKNQLIATISSDRVFRTFDVSSKRVVSRSSKAILPVPESHALHGQRVRLFYDDTLQTYFRRLHFSPDAMLVAVPSGHVEPEQNLNIKPIHAVYIYTRYSLKVPVCVLPCGDSPALVVRWSPVCYRRRADGPAPAFPLGERRMVLAVGTRGSVLLYDTQQKTPIALISNIHYTRLTDLTWSSDGLTLVASSTDGFCSVILFSENELGERLPENIACAELGQELRAEATENVQPMEVDVIKTDGKKQETKASPIPNKMDSFVKFKTPFEKSSQSARVDDITEQKENHSIKPDIIDEVAMASWSDNSNTEMKFKKGSSPILVEDSEDMKLIYEESESNLNKSSDSVRSKEEKTDVKKVLSPTDIKKIVPVKLSKENTDNKDAQVNTFSKQVKITDSVLEAGPTVASPKAPRRVGFVTLSSPKSSKKKC